MSNPKTHCGFVAIIGRPNVGKSTILNRILGQKISITSRKPQTTRHQIIGVQTREHVQAIYVDTPGMHRGQKKAINRYMNREANNALHDVDAVVFVIEAGIWLEEDEWVMSKLEKLKAPILLVINKVDKVADKKKLLPFMEEVAQRLDFADVIPISAKSGDQVDVLDDAIQKFMPESPFYYSKDQITNRSERFIAAEIIREKLIRLTGDELPYATAVEIENFTEEKKIYRIAALIWVEREGQKKIIIGKNGEHLKEIGTQARRDLEAFLDKKVFLQLWVKAKKGWSDDESALRKYVYKE